MAHIVIAGTGVGGIPCAYELRKRLGKEPRVTLVADDDPVETTVLDREDFARRMSRACGSGTCAARSIW